MLRPGSWVLRRLPLALTLLGVGAASFVWGRWGLAPRAEAQNAAVSPLAAPNPVAATPGAKPGDYANRVVAYLYNDTVAVTREELGEYLIARFGAERLDFMVNRKIVEMECAAKGISVTDIEVRMQLADDLKAFGIVNEQDFVKQILGRFNKTLYEWKEDVIRPKLLIAKLVRPSITVNEEEIKQSFEARYGPKVQCRMICWPPGDAHGSRHMLEARERACQGRDEFLREARNQPIDGLRAREGEVPPIHKHFGDARIEQAAFSLKEGEVSGIIDLPDGSHIILLCEKHLPDNKAARFETERMKLMQDVTEMKLAQRIPQVVQELRQRATPRLLLTPQQQQAAQSTTSQMPNNGILVPTSGTGAGQRQGGS
jgi:hypothetical protein